VSVNSEREKEIAGSLELKGISLPGAHSVTLREMSVSHKSDPLRPGSHFRGMLIHSVLGEVGMGTAFLASHPILRRPVVIKVFRDLAGDDLFQEAHLGARSSTFRCYVPAAVYPPRAFLGAEEREASSIAFPALGTGVGEVPQALAAQLMLEAVRTSAELKPNRAHRIDIVLNSLKS
jgi:hypothetical protein